MDDAAGGEPVLTIVQLELSVSIDDIRSRRHPEPLVVENPAGLDVLRGRINSSGIWSVA